MRPVSFPQAGWRNDSPMWEGEIRAYEAQDRKQAPAPGGVVFVGSSSFQLWSSLRNDFPDFNAIPRGFGGSVLADSVEFADRIVLPYQPKIVVVYAGENDLEQGTKPAKITRDFQALVKKIHDADPETKIVYISVKPSPRAERYGLVPLQQQLNESIAAVAANDPNITFVDVTPRMMTPDGRVKQELFGPDGWHMNSRGYALWIRVLTPILAKLDGREAAGAKPASGNGEGDHFDSQPPKNKYAPRFRPFSPPST